MNRWTRSLSRRLLRAGGGPRLPLELRLAVPYAYCCDRAPLSLEVALGLEVAPGAQPRHPADYLEALAAHAVEVSLRQELARRTSAQVQGELPAITAAALAALQAELAGLGVRPARLELAGLNDRPLGAPTPTTHRNEQPAKGGTCSS